MKKPTLQEIQENPVWLRLRKKYPGKKRVNLKEEGKELEDIYYDAMCEVGKEENEETIREEDKSSQANLEGGRSQFETKKGLVNYERWTAQSQSSTSPDRTGCVTGRTGL